MQSKISTVMYYNYVTEPTGHFKLYSKVNKENNSKVSCAKRSQSILQSPVTQKNVEVFLWGLYGLFKVGAGHLAAHAGRTLGSGFLCQAQLLLAGGSEKEMHLEHP